MPACRELVKALQRLDQARDTLLKAAADGSAEAAVQAAQDYQQAVQTFRGCVTRVRSHLTPEEYTRVLDEPDAGTRGRSGGRTRARRSATGHSARREYAMRFLQRTGNCGPQARSAGATWAWLAFAICLPPHAVATATESLEELCRRLESPRNVTERIHAAEAMVVYGRRTVPSVCELLRHGDPKVREYALLAIIRLGPEAEQAVPQLTALAQASPEPLRIDAVLALGQIGPAATTAVPALLRVAHEPDRRLRKERLPCVGVHSDHRRRAGLDRRC